MDLENIDGVEDLLTADRIKAELNDVLTKVDNIRNIIIIYEDKDNYVNLSATGFESDFESIGMLEEAKNTILNGDGK
jgi:hypothetical protein